MDNEALSKVIRQIPSLRFKYLGSCSPRELKQSPPPKLPNNTFQIVNTSNGSGEHWIVFINRNGKHYFGDSLGRQLKSYKTLFLNETMSGAATTTTTTMTPVYNPLVNHQVQKTEGLCGLFCIYFAYCVYNDIFEPAELFLNEHSMLKIIGAFVV